MALLAAQSLRGALPDVYLPGPWPEEASWEELAASAAPAEAVEPYFGAIAVRGGPVPFLCLPTLSYAVLCCPMLPHAALCFPFAAVTAARWLKAL